MYMQLETNGSEGGDEAPEEDKRNVQVLRNFWHSYDNGRARDITPRPADGQPVLSQLATATTSVSLHDAFLEEGRARQRYLQVLCFSINSETFDQGVGLVICANAVVIGLETDLGQAPAFDFSEHLFNAFFLVEMIIRSSDTKEGGWKYFKEVWNLFDCCLVVTGSWELWIMPLVSDDADGSNGASLMRLLRVLRILRVLRVFRMFRQMSLIAQAFVDAFSSVCWIGTLMVILDYICAVFLTRTVGQKSDFWDEGSREKIDKWFGTVGRSMYTLFSVMTLDGWEEICHVTMERYPLMLLFFMFYVVIASYTMVSLITGVISESLISAQRDDEVNKMSAIDKNRRELTKSLQAIFESLDIDCSGKLSKSEIKEVVIHHPKLVQKLESLGIDCLTMEEFMELFDRLVSINRISGHSDDEPTIGIDEFVTALAAVRGPASSKETFLLREEIRALSTRHDDMVLKQETLSRQIARNQAEMINHQTSIMNQQAQMMNILHKLTSKQ